MKICTKCGAEKPRSDYFFKNKKKDHLHAQCKSCYQLHRASYHKDHYQKYREQYLKRAKIRRKRLREEFRINIMTYLSSKKCAICNETDIRTFEFDHINPSQKKFNISQGLRLGYSWNNIVEEIKKCRILCANCHKKHTANQFGWYKSL